MKRRTQRIGWGFTKLREKKRKRQVVKVEIKEVVKDLIDEQKDEWITTCQVLIRD